MENLVKMALTAEGIDAGYDNRHVIHEVSFAVEEGEQLLLTGPNGCGKTTLLKVLAGALRQKSGRIFVHGDDLSAVPLHRRILRGLGYLMQTRNIFPSLSVNENLHLGFWHGDGRYGERLDWILDVFPMLRDKLDRRAGLLSGGERQALAIGMVLMRPVDLLLLDEPTAGLSPKAAEDILAAIYRARQAIGFTGILVEHNLGLVHPWISRVLVMNQGRIVADKVSPTALLDHKQLQGYYFQ
uniref:Branched-chain amino acid transport system ATP-binding protein n=1 Tax=Candidatus Kentrum sp. FM TaxID=2126340 RepID=A0A450RW49_9GAMM|nr:MAG: branched-chain amino acid transport system ATP-binding protein [Candidatus Kentron sp. FM]VFJ43945.1 MAG: branched-chain amino acid transport system ATP-binding protein [Candidatus Kentron sp. FM]VFK06043.1 MAG: branched-chain amino acid transport system ATP-binding protein [Candidatus Kentron sp. FM]